MVGNMGVGLLSEPDDPDEQLLLQRKLGAKFY